MKLNGLVHGVIWPAVAGSILWTFLQVAIDPHSSDTSIWPRLSALLLVGVYLAIDWVDTDAAADINENYWLADMPLAASLSTFAVATQFNSWWSAWPLVVAFAIAILGHFLGAWDSKSRSSNKARATLAGINALGLVVLVTGTFANDWYANWSKFLAMALVVVVYLPCRKKVSTWFPSVQSGMS